MAYKHVIKLNNVRQLLNKNWYPEPNSPKWGIDVVKNSDGTITLNGTATNSGALYPIQDIPLIKNHKYYIFANQAGSFENVVFTVNNLGLSNVTQGNIWTYTRDNATELAYFWVTSGTVINNRVYKPQLFDLTEMYGGGNEPTTVEQFREKFPDEMYSYSPFINLSSNKRMIKVSDVCQLLDKNKVASNNIAGVTYTNNGDGTWTVNGTSTGPAWSNDLIPDSKSYNLFGHKLLVMVTSDDNNIVMEFKYVRKDGTGYGFRYEKEHIYTFTEIENYDSFQVRLITLKTGVTFTNTQAIPQLFDLTEMFGAGHEPATVAEFRQRFPNELYPYSPQCWLTSYKSAVVCKTKNLFDYKTTSTDNPTDWENVKLSLHEDYIELSGTQQPDKFIELGWDGFNIPFEVGKTYTLSADTKIPGFASMFMRAHYTDGQSPSGIWEAISWNLSEGTVRKIFTPTRPGYFDRLTFYNPLENHFSGDYIFRVQLEQGSTATSYVPYQHL